MARQVYFDPFGSYTRGYDSGSQQEQQLQQNVRQARDTDYKFNVLNPLELNKLQRDDALGAAAHPYQIKMLPLGYENARATTFNNQLGAAYGAANFGYIEPAAQAIAQYTGRPYTMDPQGYFQLSDTMGNPYGPQNNIGSVLNAFPQFRTENYGREDTHYDQQINAGQLQVQQQNANTAESAARANATIGAQNAETKEDALGYRYGNNLPPWAQFNIDAPAGTAGNAFFAMPGEQQAPAAPPVYAQSPRPAQPIPGATNTSEQLVNWMRAQNPQAPALTAQDWDNLGPAGQQAYINNYAPQLKQQMVAPVTANPADYNPYMTAP